MFLCVFFFGCGVSVSMFYRDCDCCIAKTNHSHPRHHHHYHHNLHVCVCFCFVSYGNIGRCGWLCIFCVSIRSKCRYIVRRHLGVFSVKVRRIRVSRSVTTISSACSYIVIVFCWLDAWLWFMCLVCLCNDVDAVDVIDALRNTVSRSPLGSVRLFLQMYFVLMLKMLLSFVFDALRRHPQISFSRYVKQSLELVELHEVIDDDQAWLYRYIYEYELFHTNSNSFRENSPELDLFGTARMWILIVRLVRRGGRACLLRIGHLHRRNYRLRIVRIWWADVLLCVVDSCVLVMYDLADNWVLHSFSNPSSLSTYRRADLQRGQLRHDMAVRHTAAVAAHDHRDATLLNLRHTVLLVALADAQVLGHLHVLCEQNIGNWARVPIRLFSCSFQRVSNIMRIIRSGPGGQEIQQQKPGRSQRSENYTKTQHLKQPHTNKKISHENHRDTVKNGFGFFRW